MQQVHHTSITHAHAEHRARLAVQSGGNLVYQVQPPGVLAGKIERHRTFDAALGVLKAMQTPNCPEDLLLHEVGLGIRSCDQSLDSDGESINLGCS